MHLRFNFDACPMHSPSGFVHLTHQNLSARALFCLNSLAKVNTQLLIYKYVSYHHYQHKWFTVGKLFLFNLVIKMTIFIIFSSQKTRGRVTGNLARLHATHIERPSRRAWHRALHSAAHIYLRAACLLRRNCIKKIALNYVENVNKDQNWIAIG